jgi:hypothetical protein
MCAIGIDSMVAYGLDLVRGRVMKVRWVFGVRVLLC